MNLILSESRYLRYFSFTILYVAQGFPFGLVTVALPAFLLERGTSARGRRRLRRRWRCCRGPSNGWRVR